MGYRTLEITIQYAEDLNKVNLISKMDVYVVVSISGGDDHSNQKTKTTVNHDDDANPSWRFPMKFKVEEAALLHNRLILDFKIKCERAFGDRLIGEVHVPLKELLDFQPKGRRGGAAAAKSFVSYQVKKPSGKPKGKLTFSYQFHDIIQKTTTSAVPKPPPPLPTEELHGESKISYPVLDRITPFAPTAPRIFPPLPQQSAAAPVAPAAAEAYAESLTSYPVVEPSSTYLLLSQGGYSSVPLEPAVVAPPPVEKVYGEIPTSRYAPVAPEVYPTIPPPLGYLPAGGLELERYPPPRPPRPCYVYPPPVNVMQLAPDWWIVDWRYDTRCSGF